VCYVENHAKKGLKYIHLNSITVASFDRGGGFSKTVNNDPPSFQKPCDMNHCNPHVPKCPLCPSPSSTNLYFSQEMGAYLPTLTSLFILITIDNLSDQGFVKSIFHPPTTPS
jgi:hypothetical protein